MKYFKNSLWMIAEYGLRIISAIYVSIYVARYLGPEQFGVLNYALAIVAIFMVISRLGMESILVRDITKYPRQAKEYMGTAFGLMLIAAIVGLVILTVLIYFFETEAQTKFCIWIIATSLLFQTLLVVDYAFQAQIKAKYSSIAKSFALAISSVVKIYLVWIQADLLAFAIAHAFDHLIIAVMLVAMHLAQKQPKFVFEFDKKLIKPLLKSSWAMVLTAGMGILLLKFDQIIIGGFLGNKELGLYTAALRLYEGWIMIPQVIAMSLIPAIVNLKKKSNQVYKEKMIFFMRIIFIINVMIALIVSLYSKEVIGFLYGKEFNEASSVLSIVIWCSVIMGIGSVSFRYLLNEGLERKIVKIMLIALVANMIFNIMLIPLMGIVGAAFALLISLSISYLFYDCFDKEMSSLTEIKLKMLYVK